MNVKLYEKKCSVKPATKAYAEKKVGKLDRYFKGDAEAAVTFRVEKLNCRVELTVHSGSTYYRAEETTTDMMASIDAAVNSIEGQIRRNKTRLAKRLRTDAFVRSVEEPEPAPAAEEETFDVVRSKKFPIKPMGVEEAILQMNLLDHTFFAFRNEDDDGAFAVVYVRNDGGYGLIEDE
ncbi:MAG: ribosome-associated translation inhibitor RaiA [Oscillospiraceae bacterium]|nr:ribosome-associated translation inhibitor RaiA [Oscillospiraceae bacterium]